MKLIVIVENDTVIVYLFVVNELGQMRVHDVAQKKQLQVRKNNFIPPVKMVRRETLRQAILSPHETFTGGYKYL